MYHLSCSLVIYTCVYLRYVSCICFTCFRFDTTKHTFIDVQICIQTNIHISNGTICFVIYYIVIIPCANMIYRLKEQKGLILWLICYIVFATCAKFLKYFLKNKYLNCAIMFMLVTILSFKCLV